MYRIAILILIITNFIACQPSTQSTEKEKPTISSKGVDISYDVCGDGEITLLFLHGWCINKSYWSNQVGEFCQQYKVVTVDLPGFGNSGKNREVWTIEAYGEDVSTIIDELNLKDVILIGHSMSGDIALEAAINNPNEIRGVIGIDNFKEVGVEYPEEVQAELDGFIDMMRNDFKNIAPAFAEGNLFIPQSDSAVVSRVISDFRNADPQVAMPVIESLFSYGPKEAEKLSSMSQKLVLINADSSPTFIEGLEATGSDFEILEIKGTGHYPMNEKPTEFNRLLDKAIETIISKKN